MKAKQSLRNEQETVDNYILTALITLIAAFIIILSIKAPSDVYVASSSAISLACLILSLLLSLWHKLRFPKRLHIFEREKEQQIKNISGEITDFANNFYYPTIEAKTYEILSNNPELSKEAVKKLVSSDKIDDKTEKVIITYLEKLNYIVKESHQKIFNQPLDEKGRKTKYLIDKFAQVTRYPFFVVGLVFFFIAIILNLF